MRLIFILLMLPLLGGAQDGMVGKIEVQVSNLRNDRGTVYLFLYNYENQYPKNPFHHYKISKKGSVDGVVTFEIPEELAYGKYAITLIDDENGNANLDKKYGIPTEGYGFSNNRKPLLFMLPDYEQLLFHLDGKSHLVKMEVQYL